MTFPTRDDWRLVDLPNPGYVRGGYFTAEHEWIPSEWKPVEQPIQKPRLDWLLLTVLVADLGVWVGLLAWWIYR